MTITKQDLERALRRQDKRFSEKLSKGLEEQDKKFSEKLSKGLKEQDEKFSKRLDEQDEKFSKRLDGQKEYIGQKLITYFYTKDEIDRRFVTKIDLKKEFEKYATKDDIKKAIDEGIDRIKVLFEDNKSQIQLIAEGHSLLAEKVDNLDCRVTKLEKTV